MGKWTFFFPFAQSICLAFFSFSYCFHLIISFHPTYSSILLVPASLILYTSSFFPSLFCLFLHFFLSLLCSFVSWNFLCFPPFIHLSPESTPLFYISFPSFFHFFTVYLFVLFIYCRLSCIHLHILNKSSCHFVLPHTLPSLLPFLIPFPADSIIPT